MIALVAAIVGAIFATGISIPTTIYIDNRLHQGAANEATVLAQQDQAASLLRQDAELVDFSMGPVMHGGSPQVVIENRSGGWIRNLLLLVPMPVTGTANSDGSTTLPIPSFSTSIAGGIGVSGVVGMQGGIFLEDWLPDIGPCELVATRVLAALPSVNGWVMARSELDFTDPNGHYWTRFGSGELVKDTHFAGPGAWSRYVAEEPLPDCSAG